MSNTVQCTPWAGWCSQVEREMAVNPSWPADNSMPSGFTMMASRARLVDLMTHYLHKFPKQQLLSNLAERLLEGVPAWLALLKTTCHHSMFSLFILVGI